MNGATRTVEDSHFRPGRLPVNSLAISDIIFTPMPGSRRRCPLHTFRADPSTPLPTISHRRGSDFPIPAHPSAGLS